MIAFKPNTSKKPPIKDNLVENPRDFDSFFEQILEADNNKTREAHDLPKKIKKDFTLFNYQEHYENHIIKKQIKELTQAIKQEIEIIKKTNKSLLSEMGDIEKISLESLPSKPGIYDVHFLEIVLGVLRALRAKVGESRTWLQALLSKKKKRGSLFASLSKKKGTQYSLSQELTNARSVQ